MGQNQQRYYERHREEILAKAKAKRIEKEYTPEEYQKKLDYNREYYKRKRASMTDAEIDSLNQAANSRYKAKHRTKTAIQKEWLLPFKEKFKGFVFKFDEDILTIEVKLPFSCTFTDEYGVTHCDEKTLEKLQREIRGKISAIHKFQHLIVIDCNSLQIYLKNTDNLDEICTIVREFILEKLEIFPRCVKNGKMRNADFK